MRLVFFGPPGAGKGTQAALICENFGLVHISTGDMIREQIALGSDIGKLAASVIEKGNLVPDEVVIEMVKMRIAKEDAEKGFILDGFPRTLPQAYKLSKLTDIEMVISIDVPLDVLVGRITSRRICPACKATYISDGSSSQTCSKCGSLLTTRKDDTEAVAMERFRIYNEETCPILDYYENTSKVVHIDGTQAVDKVCSDIKRAILEL